jgi:hypothetical protein
MTTDRSQRRWIVTLGVVWLALAVVVLAADVKVTPVVSDGKVFASFSAASAYNDGAREVMQSGLLLTFTYIVELRRPSTIWFDPMNGRTTVAASVKFDSLTGVYQVSKLQENRVIWSQQTDKESNVRDWMTSFEKVAIETTEPLEANAEYYVRVRVQRSPRSTILFWLWGRDDGSGRADFTFIR